MFQHSMNRPWKDPRKDTTTKASAAGMCGSMGFGRDKAVHSPCSQAGLQLRVE